jgi:hypothetical protein
MDVVVWLRSLGLGKYEPVFRENEIDADVLPELTELRSLVCRCGTVSVCSRPLQD